MSSKMYYFSLIIDFAQYISHMVIKIKIIAKMSGTSVYARIHTRTVASLIINV